MVLICGIPEDPPIELLADALEDSGVPFLIYSPRQLRSISFYYEIADGKIDGEISNGIKSSLLSEITGIYNRMVDFSVIPEFRHLLPVHKEYKELRHKADAIQSWVNLSNCRVLNHAEPMKSNCSKLYQMRLIKESGFLIPPSLVTNNIESLKHYYKKQEKLIYKSASGVRSIVAGFEWSERTSLIKNCPTLFQKQLSGINYRVHVVGEKVFATQIRSSAVDYRYAAKENKETRLDAVSLPWEVEQKCIALSKFLNLPLAGIDLMKSNNDWYCFEVNPSPGYSYYENNTGQPISKCIAKYLAQKC